MRKEETLKKLDNVTSTMMMIQKDLTNVEGGCTEEMTCNVIEMMIDYVEEIAEEIKEAEFNVA